MVLLDQGGFLNALNRIYDSCKDKGSVRFTFKKCTFRRVVVFFRISFSHSSNDTDTPRKGDFKGQSICLIRVSGPKRKISTMIDEKNRKSFHEALTNIMMIKMNGLKQEEEPVTQKKKKRRRKKRNTKAE